MLVLLEHLSQLQGGIRASCRTCALTVTNSTQPAWRKMPVKWIAWFWLGITAAGMAQDAPAVVPSAPPSSAEPARPLPELHALMHAVIAQQTSAENAARDYIYREAFRVDKLDGNGAVKQSEVWEQDVFVVDGVEVHKKISRDGKPLSEDEQKKENARVDKEIEKGRKKKAKEEEKDADLEGETQLSKMLAAGSFANERRETHSSRETILIDFIGDPKARTRMPIHEVKGTIAVDEATDAITSLKGEFFNDWKLLGGLIAKIDKGTKFSLNNTRVNDEVWLPAEFHLEGEARVLLLFSGHVRVQITDSDYRKFKTSTTIVPGFQEVAPK